MVLLLKQWKSRSSPGFVAGASSKNPFAIQKAAAGESRAAAFLFDRAKVRSRKASQGQTAARTGLAGRIAKLAMPAPAPEA